MADKTKHPGSVRGEDGEVTAGAVRLSLTEALRTIRAAHIERFRVSLQDQAVRLLEVAAGGLIATRRQAFEERASGLLRATRFLLPFAGGDAGLASSPSEEERKDLVEIAERFYLRAGVNAKLIQKEAETMVDKIHGTFIGKNVQKLSPIIKERSLRAGHGLAGFSIRSLEISSGTLEGVLDFRCQDGDHFSVWNSVVTVWQAAPPFHRFPTTFHDISLAGESVKSQSLAWMAMVFAKGESEAVYAAAKERGLREADFLEAFSEEGEGLLPREEAKDFIASYKSGRKAALSDLLKFTKARAKAGQVPTPAAASCLQDLLETLSETPRQGEVTAGVRLGFEETLATLVAMGTEENFEAVEGLVMEVTANLPALYQSDFFASEHRLGRGAVLLRILRGPWVAHVDPGLFNTLVRGAVLAAGRSCRDELGLARFFKLCATRDPSLVSAYYVDDRDIFDAKTARRFEASFLPLFTAALAAVVDGEVGIFEQVFLQLEERRLDHFNESLAAIAAEQLRTRTRHYVSASLAPVREAARASTAAAAVAALGSGRHDGTVASSLGQGLLRVLSEVEHQEDLAAALQREAIASIIGDASWALGRK